MKRVLVVFLLLLSLAALALGGGWLARDRYLAAPVGAPRSLEDPWFRIEVGEGFGAVAFRLEREGWIDHARWFGLEARYRGIDRKVVPGFYEHRSDESVLGLLERLGRAEVTTVKVTIPEGWRLHQILPALAEATRQPLSAFEALSVDPAFLKRHAVPGPGLAGYLLPETYQVAIGDSPERALGQLLAAGDEAWQKLRPQAESLELDRAKLWALASVIEAEAVLDLERRRISAVFWNRIRRGMKLESDPTVLFALGRPPGRLLYRDLEIDSPYNTYRYPGIPPGPICAPGKASLAAAVNPLSDCKDLFFVARGDGSHIFTRTLKAHNRAKREVRRKSN